MKTIVALTACSVGEGALGLTCSALFDCLAADLAIAVSSSLVQASLGILCISSQFSFILASV